MLRYGTQNSTLEPHDNTPLLVSKFKRRYRNHRAGALQQSTQVGNHTVTQFFGVAPNGKAVPTGIGLNHESKRI